MVTQVSKRQCKCGCGADISGKHVNAKFINQKHKDNFHNWTNPRGKFAHLEGGGSGRDIEWDDPSDSMYWDNSDNGVTER